MFNEFKLNHSWDLDLEILFWSALAQRKGPLIAEVSNIKGSIIPITWSTEQEGYYFGDD